MCATIIAGANGLDIGEKSIVGASSLVNKSIPEGKLAVGIPAKVIKSVD